MDMTNKVDLSEKLQLTNHEEPFKSPFNT